MSVMQHRSAVGALAFVGLGAVLACGEVESDKFDSLLIPNLEMETSRAGKSSMPFPQGGSGSGGSSSGGSSSGASGHAGSSRGGSGNVSGSSAVAGSSNGGSASGHFIDATYKLEWFDRGRQTGVLAAAQACERAAASLGGNGFHLPTINELRTLIKSCDATMPQGSCGVTNGCSSNACRSESCEGCGGASFGTCHAAESLLPDCGRAWSATMASTGFWAVEFEEARVVPLVEQATANALCVRPANSVNSCSASSISTQLSVSASGTHTGFQVCAGQQLEFEAEGEWCWGGDSDCSGPDGTPGRPQPGELPVTRPGSYFGALIGRIGGSVFQIGSFTSIAAPASGELELLMNDNVNSYFDNSGQLLVIVDAPSYP